MAKVLLVWDVKSKGSPATRFYRELCGYDYETKRGRTHSAGILDELPAGDWEFVSRSALVVERRHASKVVGVFKKYDTYVEWRKFKIAVKE